MSAAEPARTPRRWPSGSPRSPRTARRSTSRVIDLRGIVCYTDFFVICSGNTERQTKAIHDAIHAELKHDDEGLLPRRTEGEREARWILLDYLDVRRPHLHSGRARVLPPGAALGRGPGALGRLTLSVRSVMGTYVRVVERTKRAR